MAHRGLRGALFAFVVATAVGGTIATSGERIRGITISTHTWDEEWASEEMTPTLRRLKSLGANWVAIHPYARVGGEGWVRWREFEPAHPPAYLTTPIERAHAEGMKILIIPHLAQWGSPFRNRLDIRFDSVAHWRRFFEDYERFIVSVAQATSAADAFAVGSELDGTIAHDSDWRRIIRAVRGVTDAPLTYSANWTHFDKVGFWDALDAVGIQAYFPLSDAPSPPRSVLRSGWENVVSRLRGYAEAQGRPIVFTELGYTRAFAAPVRPWDARTDGPAAEPVAQACLAEALAAVEREPVIVGAFLWKWFLAPRPMENDFALATPGMESTIREAWTP